MTQDCRICQAHHSAPLVPCSPRKGSTFLGLYLSLSVWWPLASLFPHLSVDRQPKRGDPTPEDSWNVPLKTLSKGFILWMRKQP